MGYPWYPKQQPIGWLTNIKRSAWCWQRKNYMDVTNKILPFELSIHSRTTPISRSSVAARVGSKWPVTARVGSRSSVTTRVGSRSSVTTRVGSRSSVTTRVGSRSSVTTRVGSRSSVTTRVGSRSPVTTLMWSKSPVTARRWHSRKHVRVSPLNMPQLTGRNWAGTEPPLSEPHLRSVMAVGWHKYTPVDKLQRHPLR